MVRYIAALLALATGPLLAASAATQCYKWKNVKIGGGGGFVDGIVFNPSASGVAYARTDIGGAYRLNADDSWTPLLDWVDSSNWNYWGVDAIATDPIDTNRVVMAVGLYTNDWDPNMGSILRSTDKGNTWSASKLPFKVGGNMPGRGMGERLAIDPNSNNILYFGARSGNGLWKSTDYGATWAKVSSFTSVGTFVPNPSSSNSYETDIVGIAWVTFDSTSGSKGSATPRIFVGVADKSNSIWMSTNAGSSWSLVSGQPSQSFLPHKGVLSPSEKTLYITYSDGAGPYDGTLGAVWKYNIASGAWTNITPVSGEDLYFGFGGFAVDLKKPGTIMVAALNAWWPEGLIFRSTDSGATWTRAWSWNGYPNRDKRFVMDSSSAPWLSDPAAEVPEPIGWMMEALVIDPFNSDHWLYGTGATIYGGRDLTKWDSNGVVTIKSLADGIEETAILGLLSPPTQHVKLVSSVGDINGFIHDDLDAPRTSASQFHNPKFATTFSLDYSGNKPLNYVRIGGEAGNIALSTNGGVSWSSHPQSSGTTGSNGIVAYSADADTIVWSTTNIGVIRSTNSGGFTTVASLPANAYVAADRRDNTVFYAVSGNKFYVSKNTGATFTQTATLSGSTSYKIVPNPGLAGDVWVSTDAGLFRSTDTGTSFTTISGPTWAAHFDLGAPKTSGAYWSIAAMATIDGKKALFRSDDAGATWVQANDASMGFANAENNRVAVDYSVYGRIFVGGNGRGIFYGTPCSGTTTTTTAVTTTARPTTTPSTTRVSTTPSTTPSTTRASTTPSTTIRTSTTTPATTPATTPRSSTTTTRASTTPSTTTRTTTAGGAVQSQWGQCGGIGWTGPTACAPPAACVSSNPYYSQCL